MLYLHYPKFCIYKYCEYVYNRSVCIEDTFTVDIFSLKMTKDFPY